MTTIFVVPYLIWRLGKTEYYAPLVVVQIVCGILLGPGVLGAWFPAVHEFVFNKPVVQLLTGIASWAVMLFVWIAGVELEIGEVWARRKETGITAGLALLAPLMAGGFVAIGMLALQGSPDDWMGRGARPWQFVFGVGMSCAVTALPILVLFLEKLDLLSRPLGQRVLRYASLDDIAIWGVLAVILMEWSRLAQQFLFLGGYALGTLVVRRLIVRLPQSDRWYVGLIWLLVCSLGGDWSGLHFMVGAFLAGAVLDKHWFDAQEMDSLRRHVRMVMMPVFFLSSGLRTYWHLGDMREVLLVAGALLAASVGGKLLGVAAAGRWLGWEPGEASVIGWLLQTKALIMIIFANVLLDKQIITSEAFTALLLMAVGSTMLTVPVVTPLLQRLNSARRGHAASG